ncbi:hypothetical protein MESS2_1530036 [Mesorhizobium metallidurans STM 2683]|uniref:Uncharacterized protein n=1 Tax=Mesorhizobium metallidurans STM 2683 TaxID=1297569 RepID=M5EMC5_9HYPH|nr:hypothetical protein MESS2_1530036 [Mesorhizobium metallidurans STM 2683]
MTDWRFRGIIPVKGVWGQPTYFGRLP